MTLLLNRSAIPRALDIPTVLDTLRTGFQHQPDIEPLRIRTDLPGPGTATALLPGLLPGIPAYTVKVNAKFPNATPALRGVVCLHDLTDGTLLAILDSATITAWRTGLAAALATHTLATHTPATTPATDNPATDTLPTDTPATTPPTDTPATTTPPTDTPATAAQVTESPATDTLATNSPATAVPATNAPASHTQAIGTRATTTPATTTPATDNPATDTLATDTLATDNPATDTLATATPPTNTPSTAAQVNESPAADGLGSVGVVGVVGAGVQAAMTVRGLAALRGVERLVVHDLDRGRAAEFLQQQGISGTVADSPAEVARRADVVVLATWSREPLLTAADSRPGLHLTTLGADEPGKVELSADLLSTARVVVDDRELAVRMGALGNVGLPADAAHATLTDVLTGRVPGRRSAEEVTVYAPVGLPWQDLAIAWPVYQSAKQQAPTIDFLG